MSDVSFEDVLVQISKKFGKDTVRYGNKTDDTKHISTGSYSLDYATGGGIPIGRWSRLYGDFSSTKTLTCWRIIANAQKMGMKCAYYNIERQYDKHFVENFGVNIDELLIVEGTTIEETAQKIESMLPHIDLHVVDSCSGAIPLDELNASIENWQMGLAARSWGKAVRKINERFDTSKNTIVLIDQIRENISYTGGYSVPGGKQLDHISSLSLFFKKGKKLYYDKNNSLSLDGTVSKTLSGTSEPDGIEISVKVDKSRVCRPLLSAKMYLDYHSMNIDTDAELIQFASHFGLVTRSGKWYKLPDGTTVDGKSGLREYIHGNDSIKKEVENIIKYSAKIALNNNEVDEDMKQKIINTKEI